MRILIFSDMHGNALALEAMLEDVRGEAVDQLVCLGDAVQGGPQPAETAQLFRELACPVVMGNADDWLITGHDSGAEQIADERRKKMDEVRTWQLSKLSEKDINFIRTFQPTVKIPLPNGQQLLCYHGSKKSFDDVILPTTPDEDVRGFLEPQEDIIYCGGHTHMQFVRHFGRTFHFNPGSVGLAYRHDQKDDATFRLDPWAEYAILTYDKGKLRLEFRRVSFNVNELIAVYRKSGKPYAEDSVRQYIM